MAAKAPTKLRSTQVKTWTLPGIDEPITQDPLSFFEKNELFGLLTDSIDVGLRSGLDLTAVLDMIGMEKETLDKITSGDMPQEDMPDFRSMASALLKIITIVPGVLEDAYLIFLSATPADRHAVRAALRQMDDETGFGILETFFEQNSKAMADFLPRWKQLLITAAATIKPQIATAPGVS